MAGGTNARIYVRDTAQPAPEVRAFAERWVDLADERLGATVIEASDEFYAPAQRMLNPQPAQFFFHDDEGMRWVDGWETSRRRQTGHAHCVIRLGRPGRVRGVVFDTSFYTGNFPVGVALSGCFSESAPDASTRWTPLVAFTKLAGHAQQVVTVNDDAVFSHVRLDLHPDGGMARLRVFGEIPPVAVDTQTGLRDLAALAHGGRIVGCNDRHFGDVRALIAPGPSIAWGKGWETRRRRDPGHDWVVIALAQPGTIEQVEIDTHYYLANQPESFSLQATCINEPMDDALLLNQSMFWPELLDRHPLAGGERQQIEAGIHPIGPVSHVRLNIYPDGGVTRLRLHGRVGRS